MQTFNLLDEKVHDYIKFQLKILIVLMILYAIFKFKNDAVSIYLTLAGYIYCSHLISLLSKLLLINGLIKKFIFSSIFEALIRVLMLFLFIRWINFNADQFITSLFLSSIICLILYIFLNKLNIFSLRVGSIKFKKHHVLMLFPLSLAGLINWAQFSGYKLMGGWISEDLAILIGSYATLAGIGASGMSIVSNIYFQMFGGKLYHSNDSYFYRYVGFGIAIILSVVFVAYLFSNFIVLSMTSYKLISYKNAICFGVLIEGGHFLLGAIEIRCNKINLYNKIFIAHITGLAVFVTSFLAMYKLSIFSVYFIGYSLVISIMVSILFLIYSYYRNTLKSNSNENFF